MVVCALPWGHVVASPPAGVVLAARSTAVPAAAALAKLAGWPARHRRIAAEQRDHDQADCRPPAAAHSTKPANDLRLLKVEYELAAAEQPASVAAASRTAFTSAASSASAIPAVQL